MPSVESFSAIYSLDSTAITTSGGLFLFSCDVIVLFVFFPLDFGIVPWEIITLCLRFRVNKSNLAFSY